MPDTSLAKVAFSIPSKSPLKRKSSDSNRDVAIDVNGQIERSKRQKSDDDNEAIDLTPSHQIPDVLGEVPVSLVPTGPRSERQTTSMPESQSSISSTAADQDLSKWGPGDWDNDVFDSDSEYMSVAVLRNLGNEISLLKFFLDEYKKFNIHLGGKQKRKDVLIYHLQPHSSALHSESTLTQKSCANELQTSYPAPVTKASSLSSPPRSQT